MDDFAHMQPPDKQDIQTVMYDTIEEALAFYYQVGRKTTIEQINIAIEPEESMMTVFIGEYSSGTGCAQSRFTEWQAALEEYRDDRDYIWISDQGQRLKLRFNNAMNRSQFIMVDWLEEVIRENSVTLLNYCQTKCLTVKFVPQNSPDHYRAVVVSGQNRTRDEWTSAKVSVVNPLDTASHYHISWRDTEQQFKSAVKIVAANPESWDTLRITVKSQTAEVVCETFAKDGHPSFQQTLSLGDNWRNLLNQNETIYGWYQNIPAKEIIGYNKPASKALHERIISFIYNLARSLFDQMQACEVLNIEVITSHLDGMSKEEIHLLREIYNPRPKTSEEVQDWEDAELDLDALLESPESEGNDPSEYFVL